MNKVEFLRKLDRELSVLSQEERRELLQFYEERFYTGTIYENKTEEQVIAELEAPEAIAKNILEEFGVSKKYVKKTEERYSNISVGQVIFLLAFDLLVATWLIPTLFSVALSIMGSTLSYVGVIPLMIGARTTADEFTFAFLTAGYVLLFIFGLVVIEAFLWVTKKVIIWHLNVFKLKGREKWIKSLSKWSVDGWFKRHRLARAIKNWALVGALVTLTYTGVWMVRHWDNLEAQYQSNAQTETITEDFTTEIENLDEWTIVTDLDTMALEIVLVSGEEFKVYKSTTDPENETFTYDFDMENNVLTITQDYKDVVQFRWKLEDLFNVLSNKNVVRIEIPDELILAEVDATTATGSVEVKNVDIKKININVSTGSIEVENVTVDGDVYLETVTGTVTVRHIQANDANELTAITNTGSVKVKDVNFNTYVISTNTGSLDLDDFNVENQNADTISATANTGSVDLEDVYVLNVTLETNTGSIKYFNYENEDFVPDSYERETNTGSTYTNVR